MIKYFDTVRFQKIFYLTKNNPNLAKKEFEEYLKEYPKDYKAHAYYISLLIYIRELEQAEERIEISKEQVYNDKKLSNCPEKIKYFKNNIIFNTLKLLSYQEKYQELYNLYQKNYLIIKEDIDIDNALIVFTEEQLGISERKREDYTSYLYKQIIDYKEEDFLEHIKKHQSEHTQMDEQKSLFVPEFPLEEVLIEAKKHIPSTNCLYSGLFEDLYIFKYDEAGRENYQMTDYFKIYTFHNSPNLITMTPSHNCENLPSIDLNYLKKDKTPKVKRLSQIEKFNKRYQKG